MRPSELIKSPSFIVLVVFIAASTLASLVPSPWRDEALLTLTPNVPAGLKEHTPLIAWPAHREQSDERCVLFQACRDLRCERHERCVPRSSRSALDAHTEG